MNVSIKQLADQVARGHFDTSKEGVILPTGGVGVAGTYFTRKNDEPIQIDHNTVTTQWLNHLLEVSFNNATRFITWYMTLIEPGNTVNETWTPGTIQSNNAENTSQTEGYNSSTRLEFQTGNASSGEMDNTANPTIFTINSNSTVNIGGIAILSDNTRGGSSGILASITNLASTRQFQDGDTYEVAYRLRLFAA